MGGGGAVEVPVPGRRTGKGHDGACGMWCWEEGAVGVDVGGAVDTGGGATSNKKSRSGIFSLFVGAALEAFSLVFCWSGVRIA